MDKPSAEAIETALYEDRVLIRMLGMRRTMFVVAAELAPVVQASSTAAIAVRERKRLIAHIAEEEIASGDAAAWLGKAEAEVMAALQVRGEATGTELGAAVKCLRGTKITWRVLFVLVAEGRIVRGRPRGSWTSSQYRWSPGDTCLPRHVADWTPEAAQAELVRRWLATFGPGTVADIKWWTGWTLGAVRRAVAELDTIKVDLDGEAGLVLADDADPVAEPEPWVALLPALDPTVMGWQSRAWYFGDHAPKLFDRTGNPGPTVWHDGRVVGGWAQRRDGDIVVRLLEDVGTQAAAAIDERAATLGAWIGDVRVTPRFRTPLERELCA